jgi:hypothetical protein
LIWGQVSRDPKKTKAFIETKLTPPESCFAEKNLPFAKTAGTYPEKGDFIPGTIWGPQHGKTDQICLFAPVLVWLGVATVISSIQRL